MIPAATPADGSEIHDDSSKFVTFATCVNFLAGPSGVNLKHVDSWSFLATSAVGFAQPLPSQGPLNVILILVDDFGASDLSCYGSSFYRTPNLDRLASGGMRFTQAYSACTVCSPSRAAIMTGKYPARLHITDWIAGHDYPWAKLKPPDWTNTFRLRSAQSPKPSSRSGIARRL